MVKYKRTTFLETDILKLTSMEYAGENVLVIESKNQEGCRVLLNRADVMELQKLEHCIFDSITQKCAIIQPKILNQVEEYGAYIDDISAKAPPENVEDMVIFIENAQVYQNISTNPIYANQLKMI
jgi:hypothetical protein